MAKRAVPVRRFPGAAARAAAGEYKTLDLERTRAYRGYLIAIAMVPLVTLWLTVERIQLAYAVMGALFMPLLAVTLLLMNTREPWVGRSFKSTWILNAILVITLLLFAITGFLQSCAA